MRKKRSNEWRTNAYFVQFGSFVTDSDRSKALHMAGTADIERINRVTFKFSPRRGAPTKPFPLRRMRSRLRQDKPLKFSHELFCCRFAIEFNATVAYRQTYPNATYSSCRKAASALLSDARIYRQIAQLHAEAWAAWERRHGHALVE
jgi:hypothetical protein